MKDIIVHSFCVGISTKRFLRPSSCNERRAEMRRADHQLIMHRMELVSYVVVAIHQRLQFDNA
jgi:hypothetical protein